jgi:hypothetical protein
MLTKNIIAAMPETVTIITNGGKVEAGIVLYGQCWPFPWRYEGFEFRTVEAAEVLRMS